VEFSDVLDSLGGGDLTGVVDPLELRQALFDLSSPMSAVKVLPRAMGELVNIAVGSSQLSYSEKDKRFSDPTWQENPIFRRLGQTYLLWTDILDQMADAADGGWDRQARAHYVANILSASLAPTNLLWTNPAALKRAVGSMGTSLMRGARHFAGDLLTNHGMPRSVDSRPFRVGETLGITPGAVVHREDIMEVIEYAPATGQVYERPLVMIPPQLNRHYVLDLAPGRSLAEFAVNEGIHTFMVVWRNPLEREGHGSWGLDDYLGAMKRSIDVVRDITGSEDVNALGLCAGGVTTALLLGHFAALNEPRVRSATLLVTSIANKNPNLVGMMWTPASRAHMARAAEQAKVIASSDLVRNFAWLRPNDLVFNYVVDSWLLGNDPPAFDVLAWNADATNISARYAYECSAAIAGNKVLEPGGLTVLGTPIDLSKVDADTFHVAGYTDHLTPWRACFDTTQAIDGQSQLVVVQSGHIQSFVHPVAKPRYGYWAGAEPGPDPDQWLDCADHHSGSWWPRWADWLRQRSGSQIPAPTNVGSRAHPAIEPAPGRYARE
jgi:polyhydroxyalkanoate synthase